MNIILRDTLNSIIGDTYQEKLNTLHNCDCCQRHRTNRPFVFVAWIETPFSSIHSNTDCQCDCRHLARVICRQHDDYHVPPAPPNSPISIIEL